MTDGAPTLAFVIGPPRAGTTLLSRILHAHPDIYAGPEPHLLTPLAHLGVYATVERAAYDPIQTARAQRAFVATLPGGERDYLDAIRAMTDTLYGRLSAARRASLVVDKTPAYSLILPFLTRLYPEAHYIVLTRHPFAVFESYARSFFDDDWSVAHAHNAVLERYVPAIGNFLRERPVGRLHPLTYEALVSDPERVIADLFCALGVPQDPAAVTYAEAPAPPPGLGDPTRVDRERRPTPARLHAWADRVVHRPDRRAMLDRMARHLTDDDLIAWGTPRASLWAPLADARPDRRPLPLDRHHLERRLLVALRRSIHHRPLGRALKRARFVLDVLLRE